MKRMQLVVAVLVGVSLLMASSAMADTTAATGFDPVSNWTLNEDWTNGAPQTDDTVYVGGNGGANPAAATLNDGNSYSVGQLYVGYGGTVGTLNILGTGTSLTDTGSDLWIGQGGSAVGIITVGAGASLQGENLRMSAWNYSGGASGTLNVEGTATFNGDASIGGEGSGAINVTNGGVVTFGGNVFFSGNSGTPASTLVVDGTSQFNMVGTDREVYFRNDGTYAYDFSNTAGAGKFSVAPSTTLWVAQSGGGVTTLNIGAGSSGTQFGYLRMASWNYSNGASGVLNIDAATIGITNDVSIGGEGAGQVNLTNGTILNVGGSVSVGGSAGVSAGISIDGTSQVNMTGDGRELSIRTDGAQTLVLSNTAGAGKFSVTPSTNLWVGPPGASHTSTLNVAAGSDATFNTLVMAGWGYSGGATGVLNVDASTVTFTGDSYIGSEGNGRVRLTNGSTINFGSGLHLRSSGNDRASTISGNGAVNITGTFEDNGRVTADGGTLTLSYGALGARTSSILLTDGTQLGWSAINGGKLILPTLDVTGDVTWGDTASTPEMVNSLRLQNWADLTSGPLAISLLAADNSSVPVGLFQTVGVWNLDRSAGSLDFSSVDLTFRYDDQMAATVGIAEADLKLYRFNGASWQEVPSVLDADNNWLTAAGVTNFSHFAIAGFDPSLFMQWNKGASGNWSETAADGAWTNGNPPAFPNQLVRTVIGTPYTVNVDGNYSALTLDVNNGGVVDVSAGNSLTVGDRITVEAGSSAMLRAGSRLAAGRGTIDLLQTDGSATIAATDTAVAVTTYDARSIAGTTLSKEGTGDLNLGAVINGLPDTGFTVKAGTLRTSGATPLGSAGGTVTLDGGTFAVNHTAEVTLTNPLTVTANGGALEATSNRVNVGGIVLPNGAVLNTRGAGETASASTSLSGAAATLRAANTHYMGSFNDGGATKTLTIQGVDKGKVVLDNIAGTNVTANTTTFRVESGTFDVRGASPLGGGTTQVTLAGGELLASVGGGSSGGLPDIDGLVARFDGTSVVATGSSVTGWNDLSGSHNASLASGNPTLVTEGLNGQSIVQFRNNNDFLNVAGDLVGQEIFTVFRSDPGRNTWSNYGTPFGRQSGRDANTLLESGNTNFHSNQYPEAVARNGVDLSNADGFSLAPVDQFMIMDLLENNNGRTNSVAWHINRADGYTNDLDIAEILVFNRPLTADEKNDVGGYLAEKYGLTTSYTGGGSGPLVSGNLNMASTNLTVESDSKLSAVTDGTATFGQLNITAGIVTAAGAKTAINFSQTNLAAGVTGGVKGTSQTNLGPLTLGNAGTFVASGKVSAGSTTLAGASATIQSAGTFNMGTYSDGGATKLLTTSGAGTVVMDNSAGGIVAGHTTFRVAGGTLDTTATAASSNDPLGGATAIQMAGGTLKMQGQAAYATGWRATQYKLNPDGNLLNPNSGYSLLTQTPLQSAQETGALLYGSYADWPWGGQGFKEFASLFTDPGFNQHDYFEAMWKGQFRPTVTDNYNIGNYGCDNDYNVWVQIGGTWQQLRDQWQSLEAGTWYDVAMMYGNWDGDGYSWPVMQKQTEGVWYNIDPTTLGDWRSTSLGALAMSGKTVQVDASSTIQTVTDSAVAFGALTLNNGVLTLTGAPSTSFASTTIDPAATLVGLNSAANVDAGAITGNGAAATFVKAGTGSMTLNAANAGLANATFDVQGGKLIALQPAGLGGSTAVQLSTGELLLSSDGGDKAYDINVTVAASSKLTAGKAAGGVDAPVAVTVGSEGKTLSIASGKTLDVGVTDSYTMSIDSSIAMADSSILNVTTAGVNLNVVGAAALTMGTGSTINLTAGSLTTDKALNVYNLNMAGGTLVQTGSGSAKSVAVQPNGSLTMSSGSLDMTGEAALTMGAGASLYLNGGTLTTDKALAVYNMNLNGGTLSRTGVAAGSRDIQVDGNLNLNSDSLDMTGATLLTNPAATNITIGGGRTLTVDKALSVHNLTVNATDGMLVRTGSGADGDLSADYIQYNGSNLDMTGSTLTVRDFRLTKGFTYDKDLNVQYFMANGSGTGSTISNPGHTITANNYYRFSNTTVDANLAGGNEGWSMWHDGGLVWLKGSVNLAHDTYIGGNGVLRLNANMSNWSSGGFIALQNGQIETSGTLALTIGRNAGNVTWDWGQGGFSAYGDDLAVTLNGGATIQWANNSQSTPPGFNRQQIYLGSAYADHDVTLTNNINVNCDGNVNTQSKTTLATMSGNLTGTGTLIKQGVGTLVLTGTNSGHTGETRINRGALDVGTNGASLGAGWVRLYADNADSTNKGAVLQANGTLNLNIGWSVAGTIGWDSNGGGFAARGGDLDVTLNGGAQLYWSNQNDGFRGTRLMFGSSTADSTATLTNNIDFQNGYRYFAVFDNPNSTTDRNVISGTFSNVGGIQLDGGGTLETQGFTTTSEQARTYDGTTLKVTGDLQAGTNITTVGSNFYSDRGVESRTGGRFETTGDLTAGSVYVENGVSTDGRLGGITVGGNVNTNSMDLRTGPSTVQGNLFANSSVYVRYGAELTVNGDLTAQSLSTDGWDYWYSTGRVSGVHLNGATATINGGNGNLNMNSGNHATTYGVLDGSATVYANQVNIQGKTKLAGTLTLAVKDRVYIENNSVISPGNSVGTLTVTNGLGGTGNGTVLMGNGSIYQWELGPRTGDKVVINNGRLDLNNGWKLVLDAATGAAAQATDKFYLFEYQGATVLQQYNAPQWSLGSTAVGWNTSGLAFHSDETGVWMDGLIVDSGAPVPHMTGSVASGSTNFGHLAVSTPSTVTTIHLASDGEVGSSVTITGASLGTALFAFTATPGTPPVVVAQGTGVDYSVRFLGSATPGTYNDTLTITTDIGSTFTYNFSAIVDVTGPHMGDANHDNKVDLQDFSLLKAYYGQTGQPWEHGNFNNDAQGLVNLEDFSLLKAHYNHTGDALTLPLTSVPEPATISLLLLGVVGLVRRRK